MWMANERYIRWQGLAIGQLTVAIGLISGLSVAGLGAGLSLFDNEKFVLSPPYSCMFGVSLFMLLGAVFLSLFAVITRLLDFRLSARKVRRRVQSNYDKKLTIFKLNAVNYSCATWGLFWTGLISFTLGVTLLVICIGVAFAC